jgi:protein TonB
MSVGSAASSSSGERLSVTMLFSIIVHAVIVLGITFEYVKPTPVLPSLDVILVQSASGKKPDRADFLANANNEGGGTAEKAARPTDIVSAPLPKPDPGVAPMPLQVGERDPVPESRRELLTQKKSDFAVHTQTQATERPEPTRPNPNAETDRKLEMARLANEVQNETQVYAKRPKKKYISANTKEAADAAYQAAWVARIERVGNLNYPDEARRQQVQNGKMLSLMITVGVQRSGALSSVDVIQSSGYKLVDEAAVRIVRLAAPFPRLPANMDYDELYITRTWEFQPGEVLKTH